MNLEKITDKNFLLFCASHYDNYQYASTDEFFEDIRRIKYIKKLLTRYEQTGELKERLILNHIIVLNNCFGPEVLPKILFLKLKTKMHMIKPFLLFLNILPDYVYNVGDQSIIETSTIKMDQNIINCLRKIV